MLKLQNKAISIDFESHLISNEEPIPTPVCLSYYDGKNDGLLVGTSDMEGFLRDILSDADVIIIAHNFVFEALIIYQYFPALRSLLWNALESNRCYCTKIYEQLLSNIRAKFQFKFALNDLVLQYFDTDISESKKDPDSWRLRYSELEGVPLENWPEKAIKYAIDDSIWAYKIYKIQNTIPLDYKIPVMAEVALNLIGKLGILIDKDRVLQLERELWVYLQPAYEMLQEKGFVRIDPKKGTFIKNMNVLREHIKTTIPNVEYTDKKIVSTSKESLDRYLEKTNDPALKVFKDMMKYEKALTAFVVRLKQADPVIRTDYNAVVSSGRTSSHASSLYPSVNIQQMPRALEGVTWDIRNCYIPRPGFKMVSIDYNNLELAATAHQLYQIYGKSKMRDTINSGDIPVDMHSKFACRLKTLAENKTCSYEHFINHKHESEYKHFRSLAKPINLGFPGGIGYDTTRSLLLKEGIKTYLTILHEDKTKNKLVDLWRALHFRKKVDMSYVRIARIGKNRYALVIDELVKLKKELFNLYPELGDFLHTTHAEYQTGKKRRMKNDYGEWEWEDMYRYETNGIVRDWCTYTALCNGFLMQSPSAAGFKRVSYDLVKKYHDSPDVNILAGIHDEFLIEIRQTDHIYGIIEDISNIMLTGMAIELPSVRIAVEAQLMDYWTKDSIKWSQVYWKDIKNERIKTRNV